MNIQNDTDKFFTAIEQENIIAIEELIKSGFDVNTQIEEGTTPIIATVSIGNLKIIKILVGSGANIDTLDVCGTSPLMRAAYGKSIEIFNYLAPLASLQTKGIGLLESVTDGDLEVVRMFIDTGIDVDFYREKGIWCENGRTALIIAIREGYTEIVKALLEAGANSNTIDEDSETTPLILAVRFKYLAIVNLLLSNNADVDLKDGRNKTTLDLAQEIGDSEIIELLKKYRS
jgi:ankyrin repeat protein